MAIGQITYRQFEGEDIKKAPDGYYIAHVNPDVKHAKATKQIILAKHGDDIYTPPVGEFNYRGHIYRLEGPIDRVMLED